jgi:hypothetical protein
MNYFFFIFALFLSVDSAFAQCVNPSGERGQIVFNETYDVLQGCTARGWLAFHEPGPPDPCSGTPSPGDVCGDGSIYAGLSPDGNVPMYTTPADASGTYSWNNGTTNYTDMSIVNCTDGSSPGTSASCQTGEANTAFLVGASGEPDYPFAAAAYCDGLSAHGHSDWYLPAMDELNVLFSNRNARDLNGTFDEIGTFPNGWYWSSSEFSNQEARWQIFNLGGQSDFGKSNSIAVRCVRR